jgi:hypothetical protein
MGGDPGVQGLHSQAVTATVGLLIPCPGFLRPIALGKTLQNYITVLSFLSFKQL